MRSAYSLYCSDILYSFAYIIFAYAYILAESRGYSTSITSHVLLTCLVCINAMYTLTLIWPYNSEKVSRHKCGIERQRDSKNQSKEP